MKKYFYSNEQGEQGPVTLEELKQKDITTKTLIWHEGLDDWKEAESIDELIEFFELVHRRIDTKDEVNDLNTPSNSNENKSKSPNKESDSKKVVIEKKSSTKKNILWIILPFIILSLGSFIYLWFVNNSENDAELHLYDDTPILVNQQNSVKNNETNHLTISSFRNTHNFSKLVLSQSSSTGIDYDLFSVNIKDGKFRINVRNTYDLPNSYVLSQVSENEFFTISKKITLVSELLTLNKDITLSPIVVDGQMGKFAPVTFSKGMKLNNIYESESYSRLINDYYMTYYLADLQINLGQPDETKYTVAISKENIKRKQSNSFFYLNELNGWILSEFCDINQLTTNSMAIINDSDGWSNVREGKTRKSSILFKIYDNQKFKILENYGSWSLISYEGRTGFISNSVVQLIDNNNSIP